MSSAFIAISVSLWSLNSLLLQSSLVIVLNLINAIFSECVFFWHIQIFSSSCSLLRHLKSWTESSCSLISSELYRPSSGLSGSGSCMTPLVEPVWPRLRRQCPNIFFFFFGGWEGRRGWLWHAPCYMLRFSPFLFQLQKNIRNYD